MCVISLPLRQPEVHTFRFQPLPRNLTLCIAGKPIKIPKKHYMKIDSQYSEKFESRHIGPDSAQAEAMLKTIKAKSIDELIEQTIPNSIRLKSALNLPDAKSEFEFLN